MSQPRASVDTLRLRGGAVGDVLYVADADGVVALLPIPADYATTRYVLTIDQTSGLPAWYALSDPTLVVGFGMAFGDSFGQD